MDLVENAFLQFQARLHEQLIHDRCSSCDRLYFHNVSGIKGRVDSMVLERRLGRRAALRASRLERLLAFEKFPFKQLVEQVEI